MFPWGDGEGSFGGDGGSWRGDEGRWYVEDLAARLSSLMYSSSLKQSFSVSIGVSIMKKYVLEDILQHFNCYLPTSYSLSITHL